MNTAAIRFHASLSTARRIAAGLALMLTVGLFAGVEGLAELRYDTALARAAADSQPTQIVVVSARRLRLA